MGSFVLKSGKKSPFYIDLRRLCGDAHLMELAGRAYSSLLKGLDYSHIATVPMAALPLATALAVKSSLIYPRMDRKELGSGTPVEGLWQRGDTAVLLDDLITTGTSKLEAASVLRESGILVSDLVVLVERGSRGRGEMKAAGISIRAYAQLEDLLQVGVEAGYIDDSTARDAREWLKTT